MFAWLEDIWHAIKDLPFLLLDGLIDLVNAFIAAIVALAVFVLSLLPGFPDPPAAPGGVMGALMWVVPLAPILSFFSLMLACWVGFLAFKIALRWVKAL